MTLRARHRVLVPVFLCSVLAAGGCATGASSSFTQAPLIVSASTQEADEVLPSTDSQAPGAVAAYVAVGDAPEAPVYTQSAPPSVAQAVSSGLGPAAVSVLGAVHAAGLSPASVGVTAPGLTTPNLTRPVGVAVSAPVGSVSASVAPFGSTTVAVTTPVAAVGASASLSGATTAHVAGGPVGASATVGSSGSPTVVAAVGPAAVSTTVANPTTAAVTVGSTTPVATSVAVPAAATAVLGSARSSLASAAPTALSPLLANALANTRQHGCVLKLKC